MANADNKGCVSRVAGDLSALTAAPSPAPAASNIPPSPVPSSSVLAERKRSPTQDSQKCRPRRFLLLLCWLISIMPGMAFGVSLDILATFVGHDMQITINAGDSPFGITGTGPGLPLTGVGTGSYTFPGPSFWSNVVVSETAGNMESINLGDFDSSLPLDVSFNCTTTELEISINNGDGPFDVTGTGPGLPLLGVGTGVYTLPGPAFFSNVTVTETGGNLQSQNFGDFQCAASLSASAQCVGVNLEVTINDGDGPFDITGTGLGMPRLGVPLGTTLFAGPDLWTNVTITETDGDNQSFNTGDFSCTATGVMLEAIVRCNDLNLEVEITQGDAPFDLTGSGPGLPANGLGVGITTLPGPGVWSDLTLREVSSDYEIRQLGELGCGEPRPIPSLSFYGIFALLLLLMLAGFRVRIRR